MIFKTLRQATYPVLALPRYAKQVIALSVDITLCILTVWLAFYLRLGEFVAFTQNTPFARGLMSASGVSLLLAIPLFFVSGLYRTIFRYSGWPAMGSISRFGYLFFVIYQRDYRNRHSRGSENYRSDSTLLLFSQWLVQGDWHAFGWWCLW